MSCFHRLTWARPLALFRVRSGCYNTVFVYLQGSGEVSFLRSLARAEVLTFYKMIAVKQLDALVFGYL